MASEPLADVQQRGDEAGHDLSILEQVRKAQRLKQRCGDCRRNAICILHLGCMQSNPCFVRGDCKAACSGRGGLAAQKLPMAGNCNNQWVLPVVRFSWAPRRSMSCRCMTASSGAELSSLNSSRTNSCRTVSAV